MSEKLKQAYKDLCIKSNIYDKYCPNGPSVDCDERMAYLHASFETFLYLRDYLGCHHNDVILAQKAVCSSFESYTDHYIIDIVKKYV